MSFANRAKEMRSQMISGNGGSDSHTQKTKEEWDAINKYVVETVNIKRKEPIVGVISGIHDLGLQEQEKGDVELGPNETEEYWLSKYPDTTFFKKDGKTYRQYPRPPVWKVGITVDFPDILVNKEQFFGGDKDAPGLPLRLALNGEFLLPGGMRVLARPLAAREVALDDSRSVYGISPNNVLHKMAVAANLIDTEKNEPFKLEQIGDLLGKAFQFEVQVNFNKDGYYSEYCKFAAAVSRSQKVTPLAPELMSSVFMDEENSEEVLKNLRASVRNTIMMATNYEDSAIRVQFEKLFPWMADAYAKYKAAKSKGEVAGDDLMSDAQSSQSGVDDGIELEAEEDGVEISAEDIESSEDSPF